MTENTDMRERLLEIARDIYLREGMAGMSMRKIAAAAGVSATAIYRHYENKEALLMAVCREGFRLFAQYLWRGLEGRTPRERLRHTGTGYLRFAVEQAPYYRVMFLSQTDDLGLSAMPDAARDAIAQTFQFLVDRVRECMDAGDLAQGDPQDVAASIWAHVHGLMSLYLSGHFSKRLSSEGDFEAFFQRSLDRLVAGLSE